MTYSLGIDLGTTYTAAAVVRGGRAEVATLGYRATSVPTVVVLTEDGSVVVGDAAERRGASAPDRLAREFKRRVGDPTPLLLGGSPVSVDRLLAEVLRVVCRSVSETEGGAPESVVVTHPANWGPFKCDVLVQALRLAAIEEASLLPEPVAAATWYARAERLAPGATVAVYDLGGGTFDAAVLEMGAGGGFSLRGRPEGVERLGGVDVDAAVINHVLRALGPAATALDPEHPPTRVGMARLRADCVAAKEALSSETSVTIPVTLPGITDEVLLRRTELEELVAPVLAPTVDALRRVVESAGLGPGQPDAVLLVGGSSRMPLVAREVSVALGRPVAVDAHPKHPVALGAALVAEARRPATAPSIPAGPAGPGQFSRAPQPSPAGRAPLPPPPGARPGSPAAAGAGLAAAGAATAYAPPGVRGPGPGTDGPSSARARWSGPPLRDPSGAGGPPVRVPPPLTQKLRPAGWLAWAVTILVITAVAALTYLQVREANEAADGASTDTSGVASVDEPEPGDAGGGAELLWQADLSEETFGEPATDGALAFVTDEIGRVTAFDIASGEQAWQVEVGDVGGGLALLAGGHLLVTTSEPSALLALDPATGTTRWTAPDVYVSGEPAVVGDLFITASGFDVTAIRLPDGSVAWETDLDLEYLLDGELVASPAGDVVVGGVSTDNLLVALRADSGAVAWTTELPRRSASVADIVAVGDAIVTSGDDGYVDVVGFADGGVRQSLDLHADWAFPTLTAVGTDAAVRLEGGELYLFDPATGDEWARVGDAPTAQAQLPGDEPGLLVATHDSLQAYSAEGQQLWRSDAAFLASQVATAGDVAVTTDIDGLVAAYRLPA
jgi:outer membrane protein assembly factor BamB/actin-like ATPase involved in cell morphogenesis